METVEIWQKDPYLKPFRQVLRRRSELLEAKIRFIQGAHESLYNAVNNHLYYGVHKVAGGWICREWAPNASAIYLIGECNDWKKTSEFRFRHVGDGNWELELPPESLHHGQLYKWYIEWPGGSGERLPAYVRRCVQDPETKIFSAQVWAPSVPYRWRHKSPGKVSNPLIYEVHIGMSSEEPVVAGFDAFRRNVLPRIARLGYNTIQLMAIQEHPYYGSFGYQVSNFLPSAPALAPPMS
jgi:1,4-alpha-glucan branching enzyme